MELIVIVHRSAVAAVGAGDFVTFALHCELFAALRALVAEVFQAVANSAVRFPLDFLFRVPSVFVASELFVDDVVHFFDGQAFYVFLGEEQGHGCVRFAVAFVQANLGVLQILTF